MFLFLVPAFATETVKHGDLNSNNAYERFHLSPQSSSAEIKLRYRELSKLFHPDHAPTGQEKVYEEKFKQISEAYNCLANPLCRGSGEIKLNGRLNLGPKSMGSSDFDQYNPISQDQYPWNEFSKNVDDGFHQERDIIFHRLRHQFAKIWLEPPKRVLPYPKQFLDFRDRYSAREPNFRNSWLSMIENIPTFESPFEEKAFANAFSALIVSKGQVKILGDMSDPQMVKLFQILYSTEPKLAWQVLNQKIQQDFVLRPKSANRYVLLALANADLKSTVDQNALSEIIDTFASYYRDSYRGMRLVTGRAARAWDFQSNVGGFATPGLTRDRPISQFKDYIEPKYSLSQWENLQDVQKKVLKPLLAEMKSLASRSPKAYENLKMYLTMNQKMIGQKWLDEFNLIPKPPIASGVSNVSELPANPSGLSAVDSLEDYFESRPKPSFLKNCVKDITELLFKR